MKKNGFCGSFDCVLITNNWKLRVRESFSGRKQKRYNFLNLEIVFEVLFELFFQFLIETIGRFLCLHTGALIKFVFQFRRKKYSEILKEESTKILGVRILLFPLILAAIIFIAMCLYFIYFWSSFYLVQLKINKFHFGYKCLKSDRYSQNENLVLLQEFAFVIKHLKNDSV